MRRRAAIACLAAGLLAATGCQAAGRMGACETKASTVASGLTEPRALAFGPEGLLYVAETGRPETGGRVLRLAGADRPVTIVSGLPVFLHGLEERLGVTGIAFRDRELFLLQGYASAPLGSSLLRLKPAGGLEAVADLQAFLERHTTQLEPYPPIFSNPFAMIYVADRDRFYVVDSGANAVYAITPAGQIQTLFEWNNDPVPTGIALGPDGNLYVALFTPVPYKTGAGSVVRLTPDGAAATVYEGLTTPIAVAFDAGGAMYVLEFSQGFDPAGAESLFKRDSGRLLRIENGERTVVLDELPFPTGLAVAPSEEVYITQNGAVSGPGAGSVLKLTPCAERR